MSSQYHFITRWRVEARAEEVFDILAQPVEYQRWWPSVYLMVRELLPGGQDGQGRRIRLLTRGWLPYTLRWESRTIAVHRPERIEIQAIGDFDGRGVWSLIQDGDFTDITFDWKLQARKPLIRRLTFALRPVFEANHRWAMEQGRRSLELELRRQRARTVEEMNSIAAPAPPAKLWGRETGAVLFSAAALAAAWLLQRSGAAARS